MKRSRYEYLCHECDAGHDTLVAHPASREDAVVVSCIKLTDTMVVRTTDGYTRSWDFHDCEDLGRQSS